jgi:diadenylate cyclase
MLPFVESLVRQVTLTTLLDIAITALFIYWLFSLIRGTRAVTLVIGVSILLGVYALAQFLQLRLFTQILQAGAVVGLFALVVVFQPELRRGLERIGRVGTFGWLLAPSEQRTIEHVAAEVAKAAGQLSREGHGALMVLERETGLEEIAESGVMIHADLSSELLCTIFAPRTSLHDGAVVIREDRILAAAALLPLTEMNLSERFGTRHRAALGITEDTDAVAVVVSEESGQMSIVERARIVRVPSEAQLQRALGALLEAPAAPPGLSRRGPGFRGRARSRFRIRTTPPRTETPALAQGNPGGRAEAAPADDAGDGPDGGATGLTAIETKPYGGSAPDHDAGEPSAGERIPQARHEPSVTDEDGTSATPAVARR